MINKLPKFSDNHKICIVCEGNEEYEYLNRLKELKVWCKQYDILLYILHGKLFVFYDYYSTVTRRMT